MFLSYLLILLPSRARASFERECFVNASVPAAAAAAALLQ